MSRRDQNDQEWQKVKEIVAKRDKNFCRLCSILTSKEHLLFVNSNPSQTARIDPAHCLPVSTHPAFCYKEDNIYSLCRAHHQRIDDFVSPVTGKECSSNRHYWYWWRVINKSTEDYDKETDYEHIVKLWISENCSED